MQLKFQQQIALSLLSVTIAVGAFLVAPPADAGRPRPLGPDFWECINQGIEQGAGDHSACVSVAQSCADTKDALTRNRIYARAPGLCPGCGNGVTEGGSGEQCDDIGGADVCCEQCQWTDETCGPSPPHGCAESRCSEGSCSTIPTNEGLSCSSGDSIDRLCDSGDCIDSCYLREDFESCGTIDGQPAECLNGICRPIGCCEEWLFDWRMFFGNAHSGPHDDDWSMRTGVANDDKDWINPGLVGECDGTLEMSPFAYGPLWEQTIHAAFEDQNECLCRDSVSHAACDQTGTCVANSTDSGPQPFVCHDADLDRYVALSVNNFNGCEISNPGNITTRGGPRWPAEHGDSCQFAWPDGVHQSEYLSNLFADNIATLKVEAAFRGQQLVTDGAGNSGSFDNLAGDCTDVLPRTSDAAVVADPAYYDPQRVRQGESCMHEECCTFTTSAAGGYAATLDFETEPFTWHTCRVAASGSTGLGQFGMKAVDSAFVEYPSQTMWHYLENGPIQHDTLRTLPGEDRHWNYYVNKFFALDTLSSIEFSTPGNNASVKIDDLGCNVSVIQNGSLNNLIPDGHIDLMVMGDSRANSGASSRLPQALDRRLPILRPGITLARTVVEGTSAVDGGRLYTIPIEPLILRRPGFAILMAGINHFAVEDIATIKGHWNDTTDALRAAGILTIWMSEGAYRGNTAANLCAHSTHCATQGQKLTSELVNDGEFN
jgi:hypothetical protein